MDVGDVAFGEASHFVAEHIREFLDIAQLFIDRTLRRFELRYA
jgi:hypothetical protein